MPNGNWVEITPASPKPAARKYGGMASDHLNSKVLLFGGNDGVTPYLGDSWHYTPGTELWTQLSPAASPSARYGHACAAAFSGVHIFGGDDGVLKQDLWHYAVNNWVLRPSTGDTPAARAYAAMATCPAGLTDDPDLLMWGGETVSDFDELIWRYSPSLGEWLNSESYARPTPRKNHAMFYEPNRNTVIMFGGVSLVDGIPLDDLWECNGLQWMPLTTVQRPRARQPWQGMALDPFYHRAVLAPSGIGAQGTIGTHDGQLHESGDTFTLDDGLNPAKVFEIVPVLEPTDVIKLGGTPATSLRFDLTSLFVTEADPTAAIDHSGANIYLRCALTDQVQSAVSTYSGGVNYADSIDLLGQIASTLSTQPDDYRIGLAPGVGNASIEAGRKDTANQMRDRIAALINIVSPLDITAYAPEDDTVQLYNDRSDTAGNTTSTVSVAAPSFTVSDMTGATADSWAYNRSGGLWVEHPEATTAPVLDGASLVYEPLSQKFVLFGGAAAGTVQNKQYEWQWLDVGLSPFYFLPGGLQGRLQPVMSQATDGSWVYVLGADQEPLPSFMLNIGDAIRLTQDIAVDGQKLLRFDWRMRYSDRMPQYDLLIDPLVTPIDVSFRTSGLIFPVAGTDTAVLGIVLDQPLFTRAHENQLCRITGADNVANDGTFRITSVPSDIGEIGEWGAGGSPGDLQAGMVAVVENSSMVHSLADTNVKLEILGAQWRAQLYINDGVDDVLVAELVERRVQADPDGWQRGSLAAHVSKLSLALTTLTFVLQLESTDQA